MADIVLKPGRERSALLGHPWIFSGAVAEVRGDPAPGDTVDVYAASGAWLARGAYSPRSQLRVRIWTWNADEAVDAAFFERRLRAAIERRSRLEADPLVTAYREVHAESDGLPGLVVDRYGAWRVVQILSAGAETWRAEIVAALAARGECRGVFERSDVDVRGLEGLPERAGPAWGEPPPESIEITENGLRYLVDVQHGQKTGFYLDQRDNREALRRLTPEGEVLDGFAYTGSFTVVALAAGARRVASIDSSGASLQLAVENVRLNDLPLDRCEWIEEDVFGALRRMRDRGRTFDAVLLDPPRFAATSAHVHRASRGYKDINLLALKLLRPGGLLFTFSCSGGVTPELFTRIVAGAAQDAGVDANVIEWLGQPEDHPVSLRFPEGRYLKGLVCRRL
jgi:23S rRNA (cytosine1962-C5)-methyltransferase